MLSPRVTSAMHSAIAVVDPGFGKGVLPGIKGVCVQSAHEKKFLHPVSCVVCIVMLICKLTLTTDNIIITICADTICDQCVHSFQCTQLLVITN